MSGRANMKGTIYRNRLPRGTQVKKGWEPLLYMMNFHCTDRFYITCLFDFSGSGLD